MLSKDYNEACEILVELQNELVEEEERLIGISKNTAFRIEELEDQIDSCRKSEDIDFRVFSPRNLSIDNSDKVKALEKEKADLEKEKSDADKRIGYYSGKSEKLGRVIYILKKYSDITDDVLFDNNDNSVKEYSVKKYNPFAFLDDEETEEVELNEDNNSDDIIEEVEEDEIINIIADTNNAESKANGIPVDDIEKVCHKVEFTEKILNNDRVRAKLELKEVITQLTDLVNAYK